MSILVVTSFNRIDEAEQVFDALSQLKHVSHTGLDALMITKNADGTVVGAQLGGGKANLPVINAPGETAGDTAYNDVPNRELLASILGSMAPDTSCLFLTVADAELSVVILTLLLLFLPGQHAEDAENAVRNARQEDSLNHIMQSYQTTVSNLDHNATEAELDNAYSAVESAYEALMSSFHEAASATDSER